MSSSRQPSVVAANSAYVPIGAHLRRGRPRGGECGFVADVPRVRWVGKGAMQWWWLPPLAVGAVLLVVGSALVGWRVNALMAATWTALGLALGYLRNEKALGRPWRR